MIYKKLYENILLKPAKEADELYVISGYASPDIVENLLENHEKLHINLIVGMAGSNGLGKRSHNKFKKLQNDLFTNRFRCRYYPDGNGLHSKLYAWFKDGSPYKGFNGSVNLTENGFISGQINSVNEDNPSQIKQYFNEVYSSSLEINNPKIEDFINIYNETYVIENNIKVNLEELNLSSLYDINLENEMFENKCEISLLTRSGKIHEKSGLNWGHRGNRNRNEAYLPVPSDKYEFFPKKGKHFNIIADDGVQLEVVRAQADGKAIETFENNSILGKYFRKRIGVKDGSFIKKEDLDSYGRTTVSFLKLDNRTYYMDFSI